MAPKRPLPAEDPPPASSDDDEPAGSSEEEEPKEEEDDEEEEESGESEADSESSGDEDGKGERKKPPQPKPTPPPPPPQQQQPPLTQPQQKSQGGSSAAAAGSESESESGSESGTESESESDSRRYTVKPIASKPMEKVETPPAKKQRAEPPSSSSKPQQPSAAAAAAAAKRKAEPEGGSKAKRKVELEDTKEKEPKRGRKKDAAENGSVQKSGEESKKLFQRIWGDDDELALLQGMIDFREKKGMDPFANTNAFHHFVKKSLGQEFTHSQLANKIRVLKKKYSNNEGKGKDGEDRSFSKPHEQKVFELSKKIWGANKSGDAGGSSEQTPVPKANGTAKKSKAATAAKVPKLKMETSLERLKENGELVLSEHIDAASMLSCDYKMLQLSGLGLDQDFMKKGWEMLDQSRKEELKERWKKVQLAEMRVLAERATLISDQTNLVLEAYERANGN